MMSKQPLFANIKCVTLDLDDTLWPVEPTLVRAELTVYSWMQEHYSEVTEKYSLEELSHKRQLLAKRHPDIAHNVTQLRYTALYELAHEFGYDRKFADLALALFRKYRDQVEPYSYSETLLANLKDNYILGAITNGNAQLHNITLGKYFDFVVTAEHVGVGKPDRKIFQHAAEQAKVSVQQILHIGDSPQTDVVGALAAGCRAIWFNQKRQAWPGGQAPDKVVHCLSELPALLKN